MVSCMVAKMDPLLAPIAKYQEMFREVFTLKIMELIGEVYYQKIVWYNF